MLAGIALCLATTVILKMGLQGSRNSIGGHPEVALTLSLSRPTGEGVRRTGEGSSDPMGEGGPRMAGVLAAQSGSGIAAGARTGETAARRSPAFALITFIPLVWLLAVTMTAGAQKIFHSKPNVGFLAANRVLREQLPKLEAGVASAEAGGEAAALAKARKNLRLNRIKRFNNSVDTLATGLFMLLVGIITVLSVREWILLLAGKRSAELRETPPVWLPDYAIPEAKPVWGASLLALGFALSKELSGEAQLERAQQQEAACESYSHLQGEKRAARSDARLYVEVTEQRYRGVKRCC
jgi:hypothetical protein